MDLLNLAAIFVTMAAVFAYFNYRFLRLPAAIGLMLISLVLSLATIAASLLGWDAARD
jgi:monovalent cation:H+ antiporter, CPA1 family